MQHAIPHRTWLPAPPAGSPVGRGGTTSAITNGGNTEKDIKGLISENAVIVFGKRGCCMCHVVKRLLVGLGVNPAVFEVDEQDEAPVIDELMAFIKTSNNEMPPQFQFPAVFIGGKLFGGLDRLMNAHISGDLIPSLKKAGALWL